MVPEEHLHALRGEVEALQEMVYGLLPAQKTGKSVAIEQPSQFVLVPEAEASTARVKAVASTPRASQFQSFAFDGVNIEPPLIKPSPQQKSPNGAGVTNTLAASKVIPHREGIFRLHESINGTGVKESLAVPAGIPERDGIIQHFDSNHGQENSAYQNRHYLNPVTTPVVPLVPVDNSV